MTRLLLLTPFLAVALGAPIARAEFKCTTKAASKIQVCRGYFDDRDAYSREIAVFVPENARADRVLLHLHGWNIDNAPLNQLLYDYRFAPMLEKSGRGEILVVPSSAGKEATFIRHFEEKTTFQLFLSRLYEDLRAAGVIKTNPERLSLTGHSGAYKPIAMILRHSMDMVDEIYLFDSLYEDAATFTKFIQSSPSKRFATAFVEGSTSRGVRALWQKLHPNKNEGLFDLDALPYNASAQKIRGTNPAFVRSNKDHYDTLRKYFPLLLWQDRLNPR